MQREVKDVYRNYLSPIFPTATEPPDPNENSGSDEQESEGLPESGQALAVTFRTDSRIHRGACPDLVRRPKS
jgi:hypothetical protein